MLGVILILVCQFNAQYQDFLESERSEELFIGLTQGRYKITEFAGDPIVLWFWRNAANDPQADSLLARATMRRNFHLSAVLRWEARDSGDYDVAMNKLHLASHFDTSAIENYVSFIALAVKERRIDPLIVALSLPVFNDLRGQLFLIANAIVLIFLAMFMCTLVYVIAKTVYYLPLFSHRIDPQGHGKLKGIIGLAIMILPVLVFRNLFPILVSYGVLLMFVLSTRERNWLRVLFALLILGYVFSLPLHNLVNFLTKDSRIHQLYEMVYYDNDVTIEAENDSEKILSAYALKQKGELDEAMSLYEEMYYKGHREIAVVNNLANIYMLYGEEARAETLYHYVMRAADRGEPFFNMGLLKLKNLEYSESSRYMAEARRKGLSSPSNVPLDIMPSIREYYEILLSERIDVFDSVNPVFFFTFALMFALTFLPFRFSSPYYCGACGRAICQKCKEENDGETVCKDCFGRLKSTENVEMEAILKHSVTKRRHRMRSAIAYVINILVPGSGLIYTNRNLVGLLIVCVVMLAYIPLLMSEFFVKPAGWVSLPMTPIFVALAVIVAGVAYIYTFLSLRGYHGN
ncbi:MAG: hypothetical protein JSU64_03910 [candidate division WOR-3 bacterium]|nr:MAG: hypothetical protein JSU64_03910 [candidate division WOR-3 bacterium]